MVWRGFPVSPPPVHLLTNTYIIYVFREIAAECGFEADEENTAVIDHLNFDQSLDKSGKHTVIVADPDNLIKAEAIVGKNVNNLNPILYKGTGLIVDR